MFILTLLNPMKTSLSQALSSVTDPNGFMLEIMDEEKFGTIFKPEVSKQFYQQDFRFHLDQILTKARSKIVLG